MGIFSILLGANKNYRRLKLPVSNLSPECRAPYIILGATKTIIDCNSVLVNKSMTKRATCKKLCDGFNALDETS